MTARARPTSWRTAPRRWRRRTKRSIFLDFPISKLPAPEKEGLSKGILDGIDMDSYRVEKRAVQQTMLSAEDRYYCRSSAVRNATGP